MEDEWLKDMEKVSDLIPQGTEVTALERGDTEDFFLKAKERLCGRAQLEVTKNTQESLMKMCNNKENNSNYINRIIGEHMVDGKPKTKCQLLNCKEPCIWGSREALTRII